METPKPLICYYGECQKEANEHFKTAPIIVNMITGAAVRYIFCSWQHQLAYMSESFPDIRTSKYE